MRILKSNKLNDIIAFLKFVVLQSHVKYKRDQILNDPHWKMYDQHRQDLIDAIKIILVFYFDNLFCRRNNKNNNNIIRSIHAKPSILSKIKLYVNVFIQSLRD